MQQAAANVQEESMVLNGPLIGCVDPTCSYISLVVHIRLVSCYDVAFLLKNKLSLNQ